MHAHRRLARAQHVKAHPRHDRRQPSSQVLDAARVGAAEAELGLLHGVVRLAQRAEHPVSYRPQVGPIGLEALRQPFVSFVEILFAFGQSSFSSFSSLRRKTGKIRCISFPCSNTSSNNHASSSIGHIPLSRSVIVVTSATRLM